MWDLALCRPFHLLPVPKTELFLTDNRGWGVKAAEQIPRGTFIVEYAGTFCLTINCIDSRPHCMQGLHGACNGQWGLFELWDWCAVGEVIEDHECRRRMAQAKENGQQHFYMMELAPGLIIDARNKCVDLRICLACMPDGDDHTASMRVLVHTEACKQVHVVIRVW